MLGRSPSHRIARPSVRAAAFILDVVETLRWGAICTIILVAPIGNWAVQRWLASGVRQPVKAAAYRLSWWGRRGAQAWSAAVYRAGWWSRYAREHVRILIGLPQVAFWHVRDWSRVRLNRLRNARAASSETRRRLVH